MSDPKENWNPEDGPPPSDEELLAAAGLAVALEKGATDDLAAAALLSTALRVRALEHPDASAARAASERAVRAALAGHTRSWWTRAPRLRMVAAAAAVLTAAGVGGGAWLTSRSSEVAERPRAGAAFDAPVEPGAGSGPSTRLYDHELRSYRAAMLGGDE